jgi:8-oxo-dGTP pyrophosphatase MutT (NUDIX family)/transcriptional regulator with XRE-family HTH domain
VGSNLSKRPIRRSDIRPLADDKGIPLWSRRLTERRVVRDCSYAEVAHRLRMLWRQQEGSDCGVTARTVWRWEHGTRPLARYRRLLRAVYHASSEELGFRVAQAPARPEVDAHAVNSQLARTSPSTTPVARRAGVESVLQAFRAADRQVGGGYLYGAAIRYLTCEVEPELGTSTPAAFAAAAALTEMAGWMAHDAAMIGSRSGISIDAARRELREELGLHVDITSLLCVDWIPPHGPWDDTVVFVFDGGTLSPDAMAALRLSDDELSDFRFCALQEAAELLRPYVWQRANTALAALRAGRPRYVHRGTTAF